MTYKKTFVINEILDTEQSYVNHLKEIVEEYLEYWSHTHVLCKEHCKNLFGNITEIYAFSRTFLNELKLANKSASKIAHCFLKNHLKFIIYLKYCINFQNSHAILSEITQNRQPTSIIHLRQKQLGHRLPLDSYLVLPVQRILRYHLLLKKLAAYILDNAKDHALVLKAYDKMVLLAKIIDETKHKYEKSCRVNWMRTMIKNWKDVIKVDLSNNCFELHTEGDLIIAGTKKKVRVFLLNNIILITRELKCGLLEYKAHILIRNLTVIQNVKGNSLYFCLMSNVTMYTLQASSKEEKINWVKMLNDLKEDTLEHPIIDDAELMAEHFYIPRSIILKWLINLRGFSL